MGAWSDNLKADIKSKLEGVKEHDIKFFRVEEFIRNIERTEKYAINCPECTNHKADIEWGVKKIEIAVNVPGQVRRDFDRLTYRLSNHLMKKHGYYPPFHFTYLYSFYGMVAGLVAGYIGLKLFPTKDWIALIIGFTLGLLAGNILGGRKDWKIRRSKKLM